MNPRTNLPPPHPPAIRRSYFSTVAGTGRLPLAYSYICERHLPISGPRRVPRQRGPAMSRRRCGSQLDSWEGMWLRLTLFGVQA